MPPTTDKAGVIAPPPLLLLGAVAIGLALHHWVIPIGFGLAPGIRYGLGGVSIAAALGIAFSAIRLFSRAGTHVEPWKPSTALVTGGIYGYTRNPMYLGMALLLVGLSLIFDSVTLLLMLVPFLLVIRYGVIAREERYLTSKFPTEYPAFQKRVRRWF